MGEVTEINDSYLELDIPSMSVQQRHQFLLAAVAPRPIAFAGTVDRQGRVNLSPFSFFNAFGANPAYIAISPALRGTDGTPKHTYLNIIETGEFTVSVVDFSMVEQVSLSSSSFPEGVDEFVKSGFNKKASRKISPPGVFESPCVLECKLVQHLELGGKPGSGNLLLGEVVFMHVKQSVLDAEGRIDPFKIDQVSRLGGEWYSRSREGLFEVPKPPGRGYGIGFDQLPQTIRESSVLTGSDLARLAGVLEAPTARKVDPSIFEMAYAQSEVHLHELIQDYIRKNEIEKAWQAVFFLEDQK